MEHENRDEAVVEPAPKAEPKLALTLLVALSIAVGVLLTLLIGGTLYHFQAGAAVSNELAATKEELKRKTLQLGQMEVQVSGLSNQIHTLKEFAIAKASASAATAAAGGEAGVESGDPHPK